MPLRRTLLVALAGVLLILLVFGAHALIQHQLTAIVAPAPTTTSTATATPVPTATPTPTTPTAAPTATPGPPTNTPAPTNTPPPTVTPFPTAPPTPVGPIVTNTKLGVGVYSSTINAQNLAVLRPAAILLQDPDPRTAPDFRRLFPKALIVGRHFMVDGDPLLPQCSNPNEDHRAKGVFLADYIARTAVPLKGVVDAWVSDNEQTDAKRPQELPCHADFQLGFIEELQGKYGIDAVAGNDASGALEPTDYPKYFAKPIAAAAYFGIHAYGAPEANKDPSTRRLDNGQDSIYYALRYRLIHDQLAGAGIMPKKGFLLTETGLYDGWRGYVDENTMAAQFLWLEQEIEQDSYVKAQFIFGMGLQGRFAPFDILGTRVVTILGAFNAAHPGTV
jgi:hypothetical protein